MTASSMDLSEGEYLSGEYILRLKFSNKMEQLVNLLKEKKLAGKDLPICFLLDLKMSITKIGDTGNEKLPELVRVEWP